MNDAAAFHRTGNTSAYGKRSEGVKALISVSTKADLQKACADAGLTESEFVAILIEVAVHGREHVLKLHQARIERVLAMGRE